MNSFSARTRNLAEIGLLAGLYFVTARLGQLLAIPPGNVTPVWIPSGIILVAVLVRGYRVWPGIFIGAFAGNVWAYFSSDSVGAVLRCLFAGTANGLGDTLGAVLGAYLIIRTTHGRDPLGRAADVMKLIVFGAVLGAGLSALFGVTALSLAGFVSWHDYVFSFATWWTGDGVGVLVIAPLLLAWREGWRGCRCGREELLFAVLLPTASLGSLQLFPEVPGLVILPLLLWAVFRFERRVLTAGIVMAAALVVVMAALGLSPFAGSNVPDGLMHLQLFLTLITVPMLVLCGALAESARARDRLLTLNRELDERVQKRTGQLEAEIAGRRCIEAQSRRTAQFLQAVIDHSPCLVYAKDAAGRFIMASQPLATLFGQLSPAQLVGKTSHDFLPKAIADQHRANDLEVAARRATVECEEAVDAIEGCRTFLTAKFPLYDAAGILYAVGGTSIEITARKRAEVELETQRERLAQSNAELTRLNRLMSSRELRVIELKQQLNDLATRLDEPRLYPLAFLDAAAAAIVRTTPKPVDQESEPGG